MDLKPTPKGYPSRCHPARPNVAKGLCSRCYDLARYSRRFLHPNFNYAEIAELTGVTVPQARLIVRTIATSMRDALLRGEKIRINGFGSWVVKPCRITGHSVGNPAWGGTVKVRKTKTIKFKPYAALRYMVNPQDFT